mmetsp:Transcript_9388/g.23025  ORF Transcript_9388/g.23025 Transcript_9388/m.23025 type:complete len:271 (-) Transcript_9388:1285-2097(-)
MLGLRAIQLVLRRRSAARNDGYGIGRGSTGGSGREGVFSRRLLLHGRLLWHQQPGGGGGRGGHSQDGWRVYLHSPCLRAPAGDSKGVPLRSSRAYLGHGPPPLPHSADGNAAGRRQSRDYRGIFWHPPLLRLCWARERRALPPDCCHPGMERGEQSRAGPHQTGGSGRVSGDLASGGPRRIRRRSDLPPDDMDVPALRHKRRAGDPRGARCCSSGGSCCREERGSRCRGKRGSRDGRQQAVVGCAGQRRGQEDIIRSAPLEEPHLRAGDY